MDHNILTGTVIEENYLCGGRPVLYDPIGFVGEAVNLHHKRKKLVEEAQSEDDAPGNLAKILASYNIAYGREGVADTSNSLAPRGGRKVKAKEYYGFQVDPYKARKTAAKKK